MNSYKLRTRRRKSAVAKPLAKQSYRVRAKVWLYSGAAAWHFVTVPVATSRKIKKKFEFMARGWGSLPVEVTFGKSSWRTSIFPDKKAGAYLLPIKSEIRKKEKIKEGAVLSFDLSLFS